VRGNQDLTVWTRHLQSGATLVVRRLTNLAKVSAEVEMQAFAVGLTTHRPGRSARAAGLLAVMLVVGACTSPSSSESTNPQASTAQASSGSTQPLPSAESSVASSPTAGEGITGTWAGTWTRTTPAVAGGGDLTLTLQQQGNAISGTVTETGSACITTANVIGTVDGSTVTFGFSDGGVTASYTATQSGSTLTGTYTVECAAGAGTADWQATRH